MTSANWLLAGLLVGTITTFAALAPSAIKALSLALS